MKKLLAFLLSASMIVSGMAMPAYAGENEESEAVQEDTEQYDTASDNAEESIVEEGSASSEILLDDETYETEQTAAQDIAVDEYERNHSEAEASDAAEAETLESERTDETENSDELGMISAEDIDNECGENLAWTITDGVLSIEGTGAMESYSAYAAVPWYEFAADVTGIHIAEGVTSISNYAFYGMTGITEAVIPSTVVSIGKYAFYGCTSMTDVYIPASVETIDSYAFSGCSALSNMYIDDVGSWLKISFGNCNWRQSIQWVHQFIQCHTGFYGNLYRERCFLRMQQSFKTLSYQRRCVHEYYVRKCKILSQLLCDKYLCQ